jgi:ABC-type siderophore export system fused ATPase/permease subunit
MERKNGIYSLAASIATSIVIVLLFYILADGKVSTNPEMYKPIDMYAGMVYVFVLSMIVSASIWPGIIEKKIME